MLVPCEYTNCVLANHHAGPHSFEDAEVLNDIVAWHKDKPKVLQLSGLHDGDNLMGSYSIAIAPPINRRPAYNHRKLDLHMFFSSNLMWVVAPKNASVEMSMKEWRLRLKDRCATPNLSVKTWQRQRADGTWEDVPELRCLLPSEVATDAVPSGRASDVEAPARPHHVSPSDTAFTDTAVLAPDRTTGGSLATKQVGQEAMEGAEESEHARLVVRLRSHMAAKGLSQGLTAKICGLSSGGKLCMWLGHAAQALVPHAEREVDTLVAKYLDSLAARARVRAALTLRVSSERGETGECMVGLRLSLEAAKPSKLLASSRRAEKRLRTELEGRETLEGQGAQVAAAARATAQRGVGEPNPAEGRRQAPSTGAPGPRPDPAAPPAPPSSADMGSLEWAGGRREKRRLPEAVARTMQAEAEAALRTALEEGLVLERAPVCSIASGFVGVRELPPAARVDGHPRYSAVVELRHGPNDRFKRRVLGNSYTCAEAAACAVARAKRAVKQGHVPPMWGSRVEMSRVNASLP